MDAAAPHILIIHADQHRWDCLGTYGNTDVRTPNIDTLARDGVRYDNHFSSFPVCTPSRYSLLCGLPVHRHGGWTNHSTPYADTAFFPQLLTAGGYRTAAVGKMHFTPTYLDVGFQEMLLCEQDGVGRWDDDYHRDLMDRGVADWMDLEDQRREYREHAPAAYRETFGAHATNLPEGLSTSAWIGDGALESLSQWGAEPRMLMVGFVKPHHPFDPPPEWADLYDPQSLQLPLGWTEEVPDHDYAIQPGYFDHRELTVPVLRRVMAHYYGCISEIDSYVGRMLDVLRDRGLYDSTLVIYTSDHGDYLGHHHMSLKGGHMYDPLIRIPLIMKYPGGRGAGTTSPVLCSNTDIAPTLLDLAGLPAPPAMQGASLAGSFSGHELVLAHAKSGRLAMARTLDHKLLTDGDGQDMLFDLHDDPHELVNLLESPGGPGSVEVAEDLKRRIRGWEREGSFETQLDENAPIIEAENARRGTPDERETVIRYFEGQMRTIQTDPSRWSME